ncbi:MAG: helicase HerA-like domain-containing protein [Polyangiales bacterium]
MGSIRFGLSSTRAVELPLSVANRHGLIAGATGTGKTVTLRVLVEQLSRAGVPVFLPDIKGDLTGLAQPGSDNPKLQERIARAGISDFAFQAAPVVFWDVLGESGHPVRATVSEMGPLLLSQLLGLNETQQGVLSILFKVADDRGLLLLDLKDLRAMLQHVGENAADYKTRYGNVSAASVGAIQRSLLTLEEQGAEKFFGEPALELDDLLQTSADGRGVINVLVADKLVQQPKLYATFLLFILAELFESLPEVGDADKPKLVFIFDEAHLLFALGSKALQQRVEQVVRLIRSKGVGIFFATQNPLDVPETVLGQLGNRVQHALRAFTPKDQKVIKAVAGTFRPGPGVDPLQAITELSVGEALVSCLDEQGVPAPVERVWIDPPRSRFPPLSSQELQAVIAQSDLHGHYEQAIDRESAFEKLAARAEPAEPSEAPAEPESSPFGDAFEAFATSAMRAAGSQVGRRLMRGVLESMLGGPAPRKRRSRR